MLPVANDPPTHTLHVLAENACAAIGVGFGRGEAVWFVSERTAGAEEPLSTGWAGEGDTTSI